MKSIMRSLLSMMIIIAMSVVLISCGGEKPGNVENVTVDYGTSEVYSQEDLEAAVNRIKDEFTNWKGCELHTLVYAGDESIDEENISWLNELAEANDLSTPIVEVAEFTSSFHSPVKGGDAWEADTEYEDWQWWLGRTEGGEWQLITWGY